jgi:hypothetical protein
LDLSGPSREARECDRRTFEAIKLCGASICTHNLLTDIQSTTRTDCRGAVKGRAGVDEPEVSVLIWVVLASFVVAAFVLARWTAEDTHAPPQRSASESATPPDDITVRPV